MPATNCVEPLLRIIEEDTDQYKFYAADLLNRLMDDTPHVRKEDTINIRKNVLRFQGNRIFLG